MLARPHLSSVAILLEGQSGQLRGTARVAVTLASPHHIVRVSCSCPHAFSFIFCVFSCLLLRLRSSTLSSSVYSPYGSRRVHFVPRASGFPFFTSFPFFRLFAIPFVPQFLVLTPIPIFSTLFGHCLSRIGHMS